MNDLETHARALADKAMKMITDRQVPKFLDLELTHLVERVYSALSPGVSGATLKTEKEIEQEFYDMMLSEVRRPHKDPELKRAIAEVESIHNYHLNPGAIQKAAYDGIKRAFILGALWAFKQPPEDKKAD